MNRYPHEPGHQDTDTSLEAAVSMSVRAVSLRNQCLKILRYRDATADECARLLNESVLAVRPRISELHEMRMVRDSGKRRFNRSGKRAIVWRSTCPD